MLTPLKWLVPALLVILLVLGISYGSSVQNINLNSTSEIEVMADTISAGTVRSSMQDDGSIDATFFDKDELIANLTAKIIEVQKNHSYDVKFDYVFLDADKKVTDIDKDIRSVQFRLQYVDRKGKVKASAERHLAVNILN